MTRGDPVPPHCELHDPSRHPWRRHLRARHLSGGGRRLLPAADLRRPRGPRGRSTAAQPERRAGPGALRRPAPAHRAPRRQPRDRRGLQHDHARGRAASSSPCWATTTSASPIASPARSRSSTAIPTPAWPTAPPRSSTARASSAARGPARTAPATSCCATWCASTTRCRPLAHGPPPRLRGRRRLRAAPSASPRTSTSGCAPCAPSASATCPAARSSACAATATTSPTSPPQALEVQEVQNAPALAHRCRAAARAGARARLGRHAPRRRPSAARSRCWPTPSSAASCRCPAWPASCASAPRACPPPPRPRAQRPQDRPHLVRLQRLRRRHDRPARGRQGARAPRLGRHRLPRRHPARPVRRALRRARVGRGRRPPRRRPQPPARPVGPRQPAARARRPADHAGLRARCSTACAPTSCTSTTCTTSARR